MRARSPGTSRPGVRARAGWQGRSRLVTGGCPVRAGAPSRPGSAAGCLGRAVPAPGTRNRAGGRREAVARLFGVWSLIGRGATRHATTGPDMPGLAVLHIRIAHGASVSFYAADIARSGIFPCPEPALPSLARPGIL